MRLTYFKSTTVGLTWYVIFRTKLHPTLRSIMAQRSIIFYDRKLLERTPKVSSSFSKCRKSENLWKSREDFKISNNRLVNFFSRKYLTFFVLFCCSFFFLDRHLKFFDIRSSSNSSLIKTFPWSQFRWKLIDELINDENFARKNAIARRTWLEVFSRKKRGSCDVDKHLVMIEKIDIVLKPIYQVPEKRKKVFLFKVVYGDGMFHCCS